MKVDSADEFYSLMGELSSDLMEGTVFSSDDMIKVSWLTSVRSEIPVFEG